MASWRLCTIIYFHERPDATTKKLETSLYFIRQRSAVVILDRIVLGAPPSVHRFAWEALGAYPPGHTLRRPHLCGTESYRANGSTCTPTTYAPAFVSLDEARCICDPVDLALFPQIVDDANGSLKRRCRGMFLGASRWERICTLFAHLHEPR